MKKNHLLEIGRFDVNTICNDPEDEKDYISFDINTQKIEVVRKDVAQKRSETKNLNDYYSQPTMIMTKA